jgi:thymidine phosphorylase
MQNVNKGACLRLKAIGIDTHKEHVAYLHRNCQLYQTEGFRALSKIEICHQDHRILAVLNIVDDAMLVSPDECALSVSCFADFACQEGEWVTIRQPAPVHSMEAVRRKIAGERLSEQDYQDICQDIVQGRYAKEELAAFLVSSAQSGMDREEILYLTKAMTQTGQSLHWSSPMVVDKHCIGGIPGNRTTMIITPIVAAFGLVMPKTSSRAITSPAGTADTMEVLAEVNLDMLQLQRIVRQENACLAWGGTAKLAPVDDILISVERPLKLDSQGQMIASILSKKISAGATHLLLDIPVGANTKITSMKEAQQLRKLFEYVGLHLGLHIEVVITDGQQPIGRGIGPVLEARDVLQVLTNDSNAPADLREKSLQLAGMILEFHPDVRGGQGYNLARDILVSGRALQKMNQIIEAQGRHTLPQPSPLTWDISAPVTGKVVAIDNLVIAQLAHIAGAPLDAGAGIDLYCKIGDQVVVGQILYRVYTRFASSIEFIQQAVVDKGCGYQIS